MTGAHLSALRSRADVNVGVQPRPSGAIFIPGAEMAMSCATSANVHGGHGGSGFYLRRARRIFGPQDPESSALRLHRLALDHLSDGQGQRTARLCRVFVHDAPPASWKGHTPIGKKSLELSKSPMAQWRDRFHDRLRGMRKVASLYEHIDSLRTVCLRPVLPLT